MIIRIHTDINKSYIAYVMDSVDSPMHTGKPLFGNCRTLAEAVTTARDLGYNYPIYRLRRLLAEGISE